MTSLTRLIVITLIIIVVGAGAFLLGQVTAPGGSMNDQEFAARVKSAIVADTSIMEAGYEALRNKAQMEQDTRRQEMAKLLPQLVADLKNATDLPVYGNPQGDVQIVEFFDYQCGYCKRAFEDVVKVVDADGNIRLVLIELPILGPASNTASLAALAAMEQGKYMEFHTAVMRHKGQLDEAVIFQLAQGAGLDVAKLREDMKNEQYGRILDTHVELAKALDVTGTPTFIIGQTVVPGAISAEEMKKQIEQVRAAAHTQG